MANKPIPDDALLHCVALLPEGRDGVPRFPELVNARFPGIADQKNWTAVGEPQPCLFGPMTWQSWRWHLLIDPRGLPPQVREIVALARMERPALEAFERHQVSVMLFLTEAPAQAKPLERMQELCQMAWLWLDAGASLLAWPSGRSAWHRDRLTPINPKQITADDANLFVSYDVAGPAGADRYWFRTWGMSQFDLPELACSASTNADDGDAVDTLFCSLTPYIVGRGQPLPMGDTIELEKRMWKVVERPDGGQAPGLDCENGIQFFTRVASRN